MVFSLLLFAVLIVKFSCLVTSFAAAFPLAPLLAIANNVVEVRTDAIKIVTTNNKPYYKGAQDIGGWYGILEIIGYIAVVTNSLLIMLGFSVLPVAIHGSENTYPDQQPDDALPLRCFIAAIVIEHFMFVLKFAVAEIVPDMPAEVRQQLARREFLKEELQNELEHRPHFRLPDEATEKKAGDVFSYDTDSSYVESANGLGSKTDTGVMRAAKVEDMLVSADAIDYNQIAAADDAADDSKRAKKKRREEKKRRKSSVARKEDDPDK